MRDIRYKWNSGSKSVGISKEVELPQFRVLGHRQRATVINLSTGNHRTAPHNPNNHVSVTYTIRHAHTRGVRMCRVYKLSVVLHVSTTWLASRTYILTNKTEQNKNKTQNIHTIHGTHAGLRPRLLLTYPSPTSSAFYPSTTSNYSVLSCTFSICTCTCLVCCVAAAMYGLLGRSLGTGLWLQSVTPCEISGISGTKGPTLWGCPTRCRCPSLRFWGTGRGPWRSVSPQVPPWMSEGHGNTIDSLYSSTPSLYSTLVSVSQ